MLQTRKKKSNLLTDLSISEISLVDNPANAEIVNGRKIPRARVALLKRDDSNDDEPRYLNRAELEAYMDSVEKSRREKKVSNFEQILKSATTREQVVAAVEAKAAKIAKRDGITIEKAEAEVWEKNPEAVEAYEQAAKTAPKQEPRMTRVTEAEAELDKRARKLVKRNPGMTYAKAVDNCLQEDPALYTRYEKELAAGVTYLVPDMTPTSVADSSDKFLTKQDYADECPSCGADLDSEEAKYCSQCGTDLAKARKFKSQRKSS